MPGPVLSTDLHLFISKATVIKEQFMVSRCRRANCSAEVEWVREWRS